MSRLLPLVLWFAASTPAEAAKPKDAVIYVVRHAEKAAEPNEDPPLTEAGQARADLLARTLADVTLSGIHSTNTTRTRATAAPVAASKALEVQIYPGDAPDDLLREIRAVGGGHLVVGHSNTIVELVVAAGGDGVPLMTDLEFDRLYVVVLPAKGEPTSVLLRYGATP